MKSSKQMAETHPHPSLPLEGEGAELCKLKYRANYVEQQ